MGEVPVIEILGAVYKVTATVVVAVHPATSVPVTLYVVVANGVAVTEVPVVADNPVAGDQIYVDAPLAVRVEDAPGQIEVGAAVADKKLIEVALTELSNISGQKAIQTYAKKDISNFKLRSKMPIGVKVTLRQERMYEFLERLVFVALPRIRDFKGINAKFDGRGNYTLGLTEQIIFPEIDIDKITKMMGMEISFITTAKTDEEGLALLREFGVPFKAVKKK